LEGATKKKGNHNALADSLHRTDTKKATQKGQKQKITNTELKDGKNKIDANLLNSLASDGKKSSQGFIKNMDAADRDDITDGEAERE